MAKHAVKRKRRPANEPAPSEPTVRRPRSWKLGLLLTGLAVLVAIGWLSGAFAAFPFQAARRALDRHDEESAARYLSWAARLNGSTAENELLRARIARRQSDFELMKTCLQKAAAAGADRQRIHREELLASAQSGQLQDIEPQIKALLAEDDDGIEVCEAYSNGLTMLGRLPDAEVLLNAWQSDRPADPEPHFRRGRIKEHLLNYEEAEKEYRAGLKKDPNYPPALYALGRLLLDHKRPDEALAFFRRCEEQKPATAPAARVGTAMCLRSLGNIQEARQMLEQLVTVDSREREQAYLQVRELPPSDPAKFELGKLESDEGNYEAAEKWLRQIVQKNARDLEARYAWAVALRGMGRAADAQREFEHVSRVRKLLAETDRIYDQLSEKPDDVEARYKLGIAYLQYRSERAGLYWLQSVLTYDPDHLATHQALADYYRDHASETKAFEKLAEYHRYHAEKSSKEPR